MKKVLTKEERIKQFKKMLKKSIEKLYTDLAIDRKNPIEPKEIHVHMFYYAKNNRKSGKVSLEW